MLPLLLVAALSLAGCVNVREVPPPVPDSVIQQNLRERLDAAWLNTGLDGTVERPAADPASLLERYRDSGNAEDQAGCLAEMGVTTWGLDEQNGGPLFMTGTGSPAKPSMQLGWYRCFAAYPTNSTYLGAPFSTAQAEYLYDYYQEWVIPCLVLEGYSVMSVPSRTEFISGVGYGWIPYYSLAPGLSGEDPYADGGDPGFYSALADLCGDPYPGMPYGEQFGF